MHITISLASNVTNELVVGIGMMHYGTSKETCRYEIELGMRIPTIESQASNIPMTKGITYVVMRFDQ